MTNQKLFFKTINPVRVAVDIIIFTFESGELQALLIRRKIPPFAGMWAIPGGFVKKNESLEQSALRELREETGVRAEYLEQLYTFGNPKRDPRGSVVSVAYFALVPREKMRICGGSDAAEARLFPARKLPALAFDHDRILERGHTRLKNKIQYTNIARSLLSKAFTLSEIQDLYEAIWNRRLDKRNFRKKMLSLGLLKPLPRIRRGLRRRPARLYAFKTKKYVELKRFFS
jgi:8-oxo-dGTP diphosphatase